jgi:hypothetical protein
VPECSVSSLSVTCTGTSLMGTGSSDVTARLVVSQTFTVSCIDASGGSERIEQVIVDEAVATPEKIQGRVHIPALTAGTSVSEFLASEPCGPDRTADFESASPPSYSYTISFEGYSGPAFTLTG